MSDGYEVIQTPNGKVVKAWTRGVQFEDEAKAQLMRAADLKIVQPYIAVMPDVHAGKGCTVGSVIPTYRAIIPAVVGVDIGCGMIAYQTSLMASDLPENLAAIRSRIERMVPAGTPKRGKRDTGTWHDLPDHILEYVALSEAESQYKLILQKHPKVEHKAWAEQLGTLGGGNHFIEICIDEGQAVWIVLHSGSRGPGNRIGGYFIELARKRMDQYGIKLSDPDLAFLPEGDDLSDYVQAVSWAQTYASANRELMLESVIRAMHQEGLLFYRRSPAVINVHHNYVQMEHHFGKNVYVSRKGAVRAQLGEMGIIPGSMGTRSYIVRGKGNAQSFNSCSHGAGRAMSRTKARATFTLEDHAKATEGVECRKDSEVIDETPASYKPIDDVMEAQKDLVDIVHTLKQVLCVKG